MLGMETVSASLLSTGSPSGLGLCRPWAATGSVVHPGPVLLCLQGLALVSWVRKSWQADRLNYHPGPAAGLCVGQPQHLPLLGASRECEGAGPVGTQLPDLRDNSRISRVSMRVRY